MIELRIAKTCMFSTTGKNAGWQRYDDERKSFGSMEEARAFIADTYGKAKRRPMYIDKKSGGVQKVGCVIGFRPRYRSKGEPIVEQHWIEFRECAPCDLS